MAPATMASCAIAPAEATKRIASSGSLNQRTNWTASGGGVVGASTIATSTTETA
jgi:hypothetical protein